MEATRIAFRLASYDRDTTSELVKRLGFASMTHYQYVHFVNVTRSYDAILADVAAEGGSERP